MRRFLKYIEGHETTYLLVWVALLVLTVLTVSVSYYNFGILNIVVAMGVATVKGTLVCLYFMHLKYDNRLNQVVFVSAFVFLAIFIGLTGSDLFLRTPVRSSAIPKVSSSSSDLIGGLTGGSHLSKNFSHTTPELVKRGQELFKVHCTACHSLGKSFKSETSQKVYEAIVRNVPGGDPHSFSDLGEKERWALVHYVESLK
ncbi:MAG: cytochrome C oxidase subunit IV family protein [Deltaproteobacteria bacterium]|nr:cytochrome C oxidase subunit IV family protein [Deltaproteobacteria bacterium]MBI3016862.1 cytochrome C oxidase subunit IV family protein [Deltaproteobacteria bacterium]